jgi:hypothetical protein
MQTSWHSKQRTHQTVSGLWNMAEHLLTHCSWFHHSSHERGARTQRNTHNSKLGFIRGYRYFFNTLRKCIFGASNSKISTGNWLASLVFDYPPFSFPRALPGQSGYANDPLLGKIFEIHRENQGFLRKWKSLLDVRDYSLLVSTVKLVLSSTKIKRIWC